MKNLAIVDELGKTIGVIQISSDKPIYEMDLKSNDIFREKLLQCVKDDLCLSDATYEIQEIIFDKRSFEHSAVIKTIEDGDDESEWEYSIQAISIY